MDLIYFNRPVCRDPCTQVTRKQSKRGSSCNITHGSRHRIQHFPHQPLLNRYQCLPQSSTSRTLFHNIHPVWHLQWVVEAYSCVLLLCEWRNLNSESKNPQILLKHWFSYLYCWAMACWIVILKWSWLGPFLKGVYLAIKGILWIDVGIDSGVQLHKGTWVTGR